MRSHRRGPTVSEQLSVMGLPLASSWWSLLIGLYGYVLPFVLYATWVAVALWDLIRQESEPIPYRTRWMLVVLVVPFIGPAVVLRVRALADPATAPAHPHGGRHRGLRPVRAPGRRVRHLSGPAGSRPIHSLQ